MCWFRKSLTITALVLLSASSTDAWALRCGSRLVGEGMAESEVIRLCGEPVTVRQLGYVLHPYILKVPGGRLGTHGTRRVYAGFHEELLVKEMLFNFGPRRLMRIIRFEGGYLVSIKTAGYGHLDDD
jgi:hypothetical protein